MIMARTEPERRAALAELLPLQQQDFEGLFAAMPGLPDHDPPARPAAARVPARPRRAGPARPAGARAATSARAAAELAALEQELELVLRLGEVNPMLGTRGCRLGIVHPEIYEMQVEAIMRAAKARRATPPQLEIMIPLVDLRARAGPMRDMVVAIGDAPRAARGRGLHRRHDDRAAARVLHRRPARARRPTSSRSAPTTSRRPRSGSPATTSRPASSPRTSTAGSSTARRSSRSTSPASAGSSRSRSRRAARQREDIELGRLRRARRRPGLDRVLPPRGARLRVVLALPAADRARRGRAGGARRANDARARSDRHAVARSTASTACSPRRQRDALHRDERLRAHRARRPRASGTSTPPRAEAASRRCSSPLLAYARGAGVDARWAVIGGQRAVLRDDQAHPQPAARRCPATAVRSARPSARSTRTTLAPNAAELRAQVAPGGRRHPA